RTRASADYRAGHPPRTRADADCGVARQLWTRAFFASASCWVGAVVAGPLVTAAGSASSPADTAIGLRLLIATATTPTNAAATATVTRSRVFLDVPVLHSTTAGAISS